jgi:hypothetical protein
MVALVGHSRRRSRVLQDGGEWVDPDAAGDQQDVVDALTVSRSVVRVLKAPS